MECMTTRPVCHQPTYDVVPQALLPGLGVSEAALTLHAGSGHEVILLVHPQTSDAGCVGAVRIDLGAFVAEDVDHADVRTQGEDTGRDGDGGRRVLGEDLGDLALDTAVL